MKFLKKQDIWVQSGMHDINFRSYMGPTALRIVKKLQNPAKTTSIKSYSHQKTHSLENRISFLYSLFF